MTRTNQLTFVVYVVICGKELLMATHEQRDAATYVATYNRLRNQSTPEALAKPIAIEV